ncbi:DVU3141 family protein [Oceanisphaera psychrotolerans]|uniref:DVU3141 family protein n=1 Tax=Oceanisphaera psychrotolerans TaxID=1414654 RepID=UPI003CCC1543
MLFFNVASISGCSIQHNINSSPADSGPVQSNQQALPLELNAYLSSAANFSAKSLPFSPWGSNVLVMAQKPYFAASGRTCRELAITSSAGHISHAIACQIEKGNWNTVRPITHVLNHQISQQTATWDDIQ